MRRELVVVDVSRTEFERRFAVELKREGRPFSRRAKAQLEELWAEYCLVLEEAKAGT